MVRKTSSIRNNLVEGLVEGMVEDMHQAVSEVGTSMDIISIMVMVIMATMVVIRRGTNHSRHHLTMQGRRVDYAAYDLS